MEQEKERTISGRDEKMDEEITIGSETRWITAYINILLDDGFVFDEYALIYNDEDDIPELVGNNIYVDYQICSCTEENEVKYYPVMPYGTYAKEYYYLPKENCFMCAGIRIDQKEYYEECNDLWRGEWTELLSEPEDNYINFSELHYYSKEEMLDKLYEYKNESEEADKKEKEYVFQKETEDFEYLKQIELTSMEGNTYSVMVPKDFEMEEDKGYLLYYGKGFSLSLHVFDEVSYDSLTDFFKWQGNFFCDGPNHINVRKTDLIEKDGIAYQLCTSDFCYDSVYGKRIVPSAELIAAISIGEKVILKLELEFQSNFCDQEAVKCLEEISAYYKVPVVPFIKLIEEYAE